VGRRLVGDGVYGYQALRIAPLAARRVAGAGPQSTLAASVDAY
jgi:hypothetical protein